jgi:ribosome-associated heat shock protein Hsp15
MSDNKSVRIDKFLWSVRIFKTRSLATDACRKGRVMVNGMEAKPSKMIVSGEIIVVRKPPVVFTYRILESIENRISAKLITRYIEDLTPEEEKNKLIVKLSGAGNFREKGTGRPTKKERRDLDRHIGDSNEW